MMRNEPDMRRWVIEIAVFALLGPFFAVLWLAIGMHFDLWGLPGKTPASLATFVKSLVVMTPFALLFASVPAGMVGGMFAALRWALWGERYPGYALCALLGGAVGLATVGGWTLMKSGISFATLMPGVAGSLCALVARSLWREVPQG